MSADTLHTDTKGTKITICDKVKVFQYRQRTRVQLIVTGYVNRQQIHDRLHGESCNVLYMVNTYSCLYSIYLKSLEACIPYSIWSPDL